jgi:uncharacterized protein YwgA
MIAEGQRAGCHLELRARHLEWPLGWIYGLMVYVTKLRLRLPANGVATYAGRPVGTDRENAPVALSRDQMLLIVLSLAEGKPMTPVQVQKSLFLADDKIRDAFRSRYDFQPYDYGPFDRQVYVDAESLTQRGLVEIGTDERGGWKTYSATKEGTHQGSELRKQLNEPQRAMLSRIVRLVRSLSFTELVSAIYRSYPPMRERSVFRD